jgi:hypothetical protein
MYLIYLNIAVLVIGIILVVAGNKIENSDWEQEFLRKLHRIELDTYFIAIGWTLLIAVVVFAGVNITNFVIAQQFVATYPGMKEFLDNNVSNEYEAFAFREKKLEYNEQLFSYQWRVQQIPYWTFVDERVLEFEPIR